MSRFTSVWERGPAFVTLCPRKGSRDYARRGILRLLKPGPLFEMSGEDLIRDARVRRRLHQGAMSFVVLRRLVLASQPILCIGAD